MKAFEIQTFRDGRWKIDSIFDDRALAIYDAERMDSSNRFSGIRVVEEIYDEITNETKTRTVFRSTKGDQTNTKSAAKTQGGKNARGGNQQSGDVDPRDRKRKQEQPKPEKSLGTLIAILALCVVGGVAALFVLGYLANAT